MSFVSFSSQHVFAGSTVISNIFIEEYLPTLNGDVVRVYLYGLQICNSANRYDNTLEHFANNLNLSKEVVIEVYTHLAEQGLVQILCTDPFEVKYLPVSSGGAKLKKYATGKYADFNAGIQYIIDGRMITPHEFSEYYAFLERFQVEPAALVAIAKYCVNVKGNDVGYPYILTIAKRWAYAGVKTIEAVREKLEIEQGDTATVTKIIKTMGSKRACEPTDFEFYSKFTKKLGFTDGVILHVAKRAKTMQKLDAQLLKYFELKLFEIGEIENYENTKTDLVNLAFAINKKIGVYYENVENIIETYIQKWRLFGFDDETLLSVADFCFKSGIRKLEGMDSVINKFYKLGVTTPAAIDEYISDKISADKTVKTLLEKMKISRNPNQLDKDFYHTWTTDWKFTPDVIDYVASLSADKTSPMQYMNKILSSFREQKITSVEGAKKSTSSKTVPAEKQFIRHSYSADELNRVFADLDEVEFK
jgi:DnaD/phage-associated family protein